MKIRREIRIGFVVIVAIALFIWGANYLKGTDLFKNKRLFYAQYGRIEGLVPSNPVVINGLKVGQVSEVYFHPKIPGRIMVKLSIDNEIVIPYNSIARIYSSDLMGSKAIEIQLGNSEIPAVEGDTLISMIQTSLQEEVSIQMLPLKKKIEDLVGSIDSVVAVIQVIFNDETRENLVRSFESIRNTIASIEHTSYNLDTLMASQRSRLTAIFAHVESITLNLKNNNEEIANIMQTTVGAIYARKNRVRKKLFQLAQKKRIVS
ncbi:MAG: MCE family protein [Bacteroidetes bacterium]|nr:MCE family protein [Bacteroidota bacterium]